MATEEQKNQLLEQFQRYLEQDNQLPVNSNEQPDLYTVLNELTELKTEVKTQSRHYKNTVDTLSSALSTVQEDNQILATELSLSTKQLEQQPIEIVRSMMLEIVDIYEKLNTSLKHLQKYRPVKSLFKNSRLKDIQLIEQFQQGQLMTIRRLEQLLQQYQVQTIVCIGNLFDAETMSAIDTGYDPKLKNGTVLEELRQGFMFQDQVLRLAEVKVNKIR